MKKQLIILSFFALALLPVFGQHQNSKPGVGELHDSIHTFIQKYFPDNKVDHYKLDREGLAIEAFDIYLNDGTELVFNRDGEWTEIDMPRGKAVPDAAVPAVVSKYVKAKYRKNYISELNRKKGGVYEVTLNNDTDFYIDSQGKLLKNYDD